MLAREKWGSRNVLYDLLAEMRDKVENGVLRILFPAVVGAGNCNLSETVDLVFVSASWTVWKQVSSVGVLLKRSKRRQRVLKERFQFAQSSGDIIERGRKKRNDYVLCLIFLQCFSS